MAIRCPHCFEEAFEVTDGQERAVADLRLALESALGYVSADIHNPAKDIAEQARRICEQGRRALNG